MKKTIQAKPSKRPLPIPWLPLKSKEKKALLSSVQQLDEQCDRLGLLDPTDSEPVILYSPQEGKR
jgi:hypothetical protein